MKMNYTYNEMKRAFECGRNFQLTGENNFKELIEDLNQASAQADVIVPKGTVCPHCGGTGKDGHDRCDPPNWYICKNCGGSGRTAL
jgi:hypothetical protein